MIRGSFICPTSPISGLRGNRQNSSPATVLDILYLNTWENEPGILYYQSIFSATKLFLFSSSRPIGDAVCEVPAILPNPPPNWLWLLLDSSMSTSESRTSWTQTLQWSHNNPEVPSGIERDSQKGSISSTASGQCYICFTDCHRAFRSPTEDADYGL